MNGVPWRGLSVFTKLLAGAVVLCVAETRIDGTFRLCPGHTRNMVICKRVDLLKAVAALCCDRAVLSGSHYYQL